jgi:slime mold repeat-containing protein
MEANIMRPTDRPRLRYPSITLGAAALALLAGIPAAACSADQAEDQGSGVVVQPLSADPSPCAGVSLTARRDHPPTSWTDGHVAFAGGALTFVVPAEIPVTLGAAGHGRVRFTFRSGSGAPTTCIYLGQGGNGGRYLLARCHTSSDARGEPDDVGEHRDGDGDGDSAEDGDSPGDGDGDAARGTFSADTFTLHIVTGDRRFSATVVHLTLPGPVVGDDDACTDDTCDLVTGIVSHTAVVLDDADECTTDSCDAATGPAHTPVDSTFCRGRANFHDRTLAGLGGNGRACSDCHMESQSFQLTPAAARARFDEMVRSGADDPLFRPIDADDFRANGAAARDYTNLTENGLVRVTIPLPPNVRLLDCGSTIPCPASAVPTSETVADVWRAVPSILDVAITGPDGVSPVWPRGPNPTGGYQLDGRVDTLANQALGALRGHASITVDPPVSWLDDVAGFQSTQFSSARVKDLSDAMAAGTSPLPDPDPVLDDLETQGKSVFNRSCAQCHGNLDGHPSGSTPVLQGVPGTSTAIIRYHDIASACPRPVDAVSPPRFSFAACSPSQMHNVRTYEITNSGVAPSGTPCGATGQPACVTRVTTSDPGRLLLTGYPVPGPAGDIQHMDIPRLRGIGRTAPYFSNNTAATLEEVVEHYRQFFRRVAILAPAANLLTTQPGVVPPVQDRPFTDAEIPALLAYLRRI